ncbi:MAG: deoxyribonuclease IV [Candidatus Paceibacterota bacterium]
MTKKLGAHLSTAGGHNRALEKTITIDGNCLQIFSSSPRSWSFADIEEEKMNNFKKLKETLEINLVYFHASYLINLGDEGRIGNLSKQSLIAELNLAEKMGVEGSIIHIGSFKDRSDRLAQDHEKYPILIKNSKEVLKAIPENALFIIENAGMRKIGKSIKELAQIIEDLDDDRVKVCLDTCHLHAAGYDLSTKKKFNDFFEEFENLIGIDKLELFHINDSRDELGSFRDRHANLGEGKIKMKVFELLLNDVRFNKIPFIIETPGFDGKGPDKKNLDILKKLIK